MHRRHATRRLLLPRVLSLVLVAAACLPSEDEELKAHWQRAALERATPDTLAELLRARYATERACLEQSFPAIVFLDVDSTGAVREAIYQRRYETLRDAGLVAGEEVYPGDRDWRLPKAAHVDSGGRKRIVRYALTAQGRASSEPVPASEDADARLLCFARRRLVSVDSIVRRGPAYQSGQIGIGGGSSSGAGYREASVHVGHTVAFDSVASWVDDVVRRDSLQDFGWLQPRLVAGAQRRWAHFGIDGDGVLRREYITLEPPR